MNTAETPFQQKVQAYHQKARALLDSCVGDCLVEVKDLLVFWEEFELLFCIQQLENQLTQ